MQAQIVSLPAGVSTELEEPSGSIGHSLLTSLPGEPHSRTDGPVGAPGHRAREGKVTFDRTQICVCKFCKLVMVYYYWMKHQSGRDIGEYPLQITMRLKPILISC